MFMTAQLADTQTSMTLNKAVNSAVTPSVNTAVSYVCGQVKTCCVNTKNLFITRLSLTTTVVAN